jgi:Cdc6-like AAA superfamily ATPase
VSKIGILGQDDAIDEIMWSVFKPRKALLKTRLELGKSRFAHLDNTVSNCDIDLELVRGIILYGPPGTGKTSMIRYVFIKFLSSLIYFFILGAYAIINKLYLMSSMDHSFLINLSATRRAIFVRSFAYP